MPAIKKQNKKSNNNVNGGKKKNNEMLDEEIKILQVRIVEVVHLLFFFNVVVLISQEILKI